MRFEGLANEILLEIFEYLDVITLFRSFLQLNDRFNRIIFNEHRRLFLNFNSIKKCDFDEFCEENLSLIINQITSLHLSNDIETPNLPQILFENGYPIHRFSGLCSLSMDFIQSFQFINEITLQTRELRHLTYLNIKFNNDSYTEENFDNLVDTLWSLPSLIVCHLDMNYPYATWSTTMSAISNSIKVLSTKNITHSTFTLPVLFRHTPNLKELHLGKLEQYDELPNEMICPLVKSLTVYIQSSIELMIDLFKKFPNLTSLILSTAQLQIDGRQLEQILQTCFTNLRHFRCEISFDFSSSNDIQQIVDSFRSPYWIEQHQWFVRCDWNPNGREQVAILHTLPYPFKNFTYIDGRCSQTTSSNPLNSSSSYQTVHKLEYKDQKSLPSTCIMQFENLHHLTIKLPLKDSFWSIVPRFDNLIHVDVTLSRNLSVYQLQDLLDRATRLYSIRIYYLNNFSMASLNIRSVSVRRLEFIHELGYQTHCFYSEDYTILARSSLGMRCEVLKIVVHNQDTIIAIIRTMPNLRALSVRSRQLTPNELRELLDLNGFFSSTFLITSNPDNSIQIDIWL